MANEFKHKTKGTLLTQAEYEHIDAHVFNSQAVGDIMYSSTSTQLSRLGIGSDNAFLQVTSGGIIEWASAPTLAGNITLNAKDFIADTTSGTKFATASDQKLGFYGATPITQANTVSESIAGIFAALVNLGLITS